VSASLRHPLPAIRSLAAGLLLLLLGACAATPGTMSGALPPDDTLSPAEMQAEFPLDVYDPWEGFNRGVYNFNAQFDRYVFLPVVNAYEFVLPVFVQDRVSNFFSNLGEITSTANGLLQGRPEVAGRAVIRFVVNSTFGLLGTFDPATELGLFQQREDFGQTLGRYGVGPGPFLVLPILGPSNVRDTTGLVFDKVTTATVPPASDIYDRVYFNPAVYVLQAVDERHSNGFRYFGTGSPFEYDLVRFLYTRTREARIQR
jgi:phospholipid-binding lipoprotein MlaA